MVFYSTKSGKDKHTFDLPFEQAIFIGPAPDGGLFMPRKFPTLEKSFIETLEGKSLAEIGAYIIHPFMDEEIDVVTSIVQKAFTFPAPLKNIGDEYKFLELFHGPTLAFKDFGARFMAQTMAYYRPKNAEINILVATSGDTGGAVASAFSGLEGFKVYILFPKGKVSPIQQRQLTTWNSNVVAIEVNGTFDDCQSLVKKAFADKDLRVNKVFGSANSINIARLLPQMVYYFEAYRQAEDKYDLNFVVPSGNFGNLTAGLFAKKMGLPIAKFIAATNINDVVPQYLINGNYLPRVSRETISNAMDVGDPSNFTRMLDLVHGPDDSSTWNNLNEEIKGYVVDDDTTLRTINEVYDKFGYIVDPHTAVAYEAARANPGNNIIVSTAHWAKFAGTIEKAIGVLPELPTTLSNLLTLSERMKHIKANYHDLLDIIK
ncbi:MAG: threonine synthase [Saprospiraceae bacterium]